VLLTEMDSNSYASLAAACEVGAKNRMAWCGWDNKSVQVAACAVISQRRNPGTECGHG
jgi:hypothetical protein